MFFNNLANWIFGLSKYTDSPYALSNILWNIIDIFGGKDIWIYKILNFIIKTIFYIFLFAFGLLIMVPIFVLFLLAFLEQYFTGRDSRGFDAFGEHINGTHFDDEGYGYKRLG